MPEWYRRTSWTPDDARDFQARLRRSRSQFHKAQYLRLQAFHLAEVGTAELLAAALELLHQLLTEVPEPSQLASALQQKGQCHADLGQPSEAFAAFESAVEAEQAHRSIRTGVQLDYAELAVALRRTDLYARAEVLLGGASPEEPSFFPSVDYRVSVARAYLAAARKDWARVKREAQLALAAAAKEETPLRYHRKLGLVTTIDPVVYHQLQEWCNLTTA
jgi:tetratricopeptide (TPR) repeat protein